jgi:serpin B
MLADVPNPTSPASEADIAALVSSYNALGIDLWKTIDGDTNLAISPASIGLALGMTYLGARGETAAQMKQTMHITLESPAFTAANASLLHTWLSPQPDGPELRIANRLFVEKTLTVEPAFFEVTRDGFGAPAELLDFIRNPAGSREHINGWVAGQTKDRIKDLLPADGVTPDTRLVLTNAMYFKGAWASPFEPSATRPRPFYAGGTRKIDVPTMSRVGSYRHRSLADVEVVDLAYEGAPLAMSIVLPRSRDGLAAVEKTLSVETLASWTDQNAGYTQLRVELPRFEIEAPADPLRLAKALIQLGMPLAFDDEQADFTGIHVFKSPADRLLISNVFHKAFVEVDEKGTEAAAATAVSMTRAGGAPQEPALFVVDRPFLFVLHDTRSGAVLFMGRVTEPK